MSHMSEIHRSSIKLLKGKLEGRYHCKSRSEWDLLIRLKTKLSLKKKYQKIYIHLYVQA